MNKKIILPILFISVVGFLFSFSAQEAWATTETLRPNASGDLTNIEGQYPSSGVHWDKVDESTADTSTYVYSAVGSFRSDLYNLPNHTGSGTINFVKLYYRGRVVGAAGTVCGLLKTNNEEYPTSGDCIQVDSWTTSYKQYDTNPWTGLAWTWTEIDALQIGGYIGGADAARPAQLTQVYVEINYTPVGTPTVTNSTGASNISTDSARLNGEIIDSGGETPTARIYWGDNDGGTNPASWDYVEDLGIQSGAFYKDISGLNPSTGYYYRCYASNSYGPDWADSTDSFITPSETGGTVFYGTANDGDFRYITNWSSSYSTSWDTAHDASSANYLYTDNASLQVQVRTWNEDGYQTIIRRAVVYFDTSLLPNDATITSAVLKLYGTLDGSHRQEHGPFTIQVQSGMPTYPHETLIDSDFKYTRYSDDVGNLSLSPVGTGSGYREVELNPTGISLINKTGTTKFILREKEHDVDDIRPSYPLGRNENAWSFNSAEGTYPPILEITYTTPAVAPTIVTEPATVNLSTDQATLKGTIENDGGEAIGQIGFEWWGKESGSWTGDYTGDFSHAIPIIPSETDGDIYYYKAKAYNSGGWGYGTEKRVVIYEASGGLEQFTTESICEDVCESCSVGECCSGFHCGENGVCCADDQTCCTENTDCPSDSCVDSSQYIDNYCNVGECYCESSTTSCSAGGCCQTACDADTGCYTTAGVCDDICTANTLTVDQDCSGCGANGATGSCGGGTAHTCDSTNHNECQSVKCGEIIYYCTQDGGVWEWRESSDPDQCGGDSDDCYSYGSGCEIRDYYCSAGSCVYSVSNRRTDTVCSYTGCSANNCSKTGVYDDYSCDIAGSCTAQSEPCSENCGEKTACSGGICYSDGGDGDLCNTEMKASPGEGDDNYGTSGDYLCQGSCDGFGNCDFAVNCVPIDDTSPTTAIKIVRTSTGEDVTTAGGWLRADTYTIKFEDEDQADGSGLNCENCTCEYSIYSCDVGGTNCATVVTPLTNRAPNYSFEITAGKTAPTYNLEGLGRYLIYSGTEDMGSNSVAAYRIINFDFTPPTTEIK